MLWVIESEFRSPPPRAVLAIPLDGGSFSALFAPALLLLHHPLTRPLLEEVGVPLAPLALPAPLRRREARAIGLGGAPRLVHLAFGQHGGRPRHQDEEDLLGPSAARRAPSTAGNPALWRRRLPVGIVHDEPTAEAGTHGKVGDELHLVLQAASARRDGGPRAATRRVFRVELKARPGAARLRRALNPRQGGSRGVAAPCTSRAKRRRRRGASAARGTSCRRCTATAARRR